MATKVFTVCVQIANGRRRGQGVKFGGKWQRIHGFGACDKLELIKFGHVVIYVKVSNVG